jgi:hypothetical protein
MDGWIFGTIGFWDGLATLGGFGSVGHDFSTLSFEFTGVDLLRIDCFLYSPSPRTDLAFQQAAVHGTRNYH